MANCTKMILKQTTRQHTHYLTLLAWKLKNQKMETICLIYEISRFLHFVSILTSDFKNRNISRYLSNPEDASKLNAKHAGFFYQMSEIKQYKLKYILFI